MRGFLRTHFPAVAGFLAMALVAGSLAVLFPVPSGGAGGGHAPFSVGAIPLPGPGEDDDGDGYADAVDRAAGDFLVAVELRRLRFDADDAEPYVLVGTQDDQWRTGEGAELAWRHVVDHDPLGRRAGSPAWQSDALRTGQWWTTLPGEGLDQGVAQASELGPGDVPEGAAWPQRVWVNVRDDRDVLRLRVELWDASRSPHRSGGAWDLEFLVDGGPFREAGGAWQEPGETVALGSLAGGSGPGGLEVSLAAATDLSSEEKRSIAETWSPIVRFDSEEAFYPVPGEALLQYHGFARPDPDLRTWDLGFNDGRDTYRLFLADFTGDRRTDHEDAAVMTDLLAAGGVAPPTLYAQVTLAQGGRVVVQYWFLYFYNFVLDEEENDIRSLVHEGDREFLQLVFQNVSEALSGRPISVAYGQHYGGIAVEDPDPAAAPFEGGRPVVYVARGSHANYPVPGDDRRLRPAFSGYFDRFDGRGATWTPGNYTLEVLGAQPWHAGYRWGPVTRYGRDLGTSARPLLQHDFRYAFVDPLWWQAGVTTAAMERIEDLYGRPE